MPRKHDILESIRKLAHKLGRAPTRGEFSSQAGISPFFVLQWFRTWSEAVKAAGLKPYARNKRIEDYALLEDWGKAVRKNAGMLPRHMFRRAAKYNPCTLAKRFGGWSAVASAFRNFAKGKREWADVLALLPTPYPHRPHSNAPGQSPIANAGAQILPTRSWPARRRDRPVCGDPTPLPGFLREPLNEQGVVLLFGMLAKDLGFQIEAVQTRFPDCEAKRQIGPGRWQRTRIEFEYESRNFREHGHNANACDLIVCWRHNWPNHPKHLEILELSSLLKNCAS